MTQKDLKKLSSTELLAKTRALSAEERRVTLELILHLKEIEARMLYAELGYDSLNEFAIKDLGLSGGSAHRRLAAMHLLKDVPEVKEKLETGALTFTNAAKIQVALNASHETPLKMDLKSEIVRACSNVTQNECDRILFQKIPELAEHLPEEKVRRVTADKTEIKLVVSEDLLQKIHKLNRLFSHSNPDQKILNLFERLVDQELAQQAKKSQPKTKTHPTVGPHEKLRSNKVEVKPSKAVPAEIRKQVFVRANSKCEFEGCNSTYQLQVDHIRPRCLGGDHSLENLRALCRTHNLFEARRILGSEKMNAFIKQ
jgi:hypothetical protein